MTDRTATVVRKTKETDISLQINVDGTGQYDIEIPVAFLKHMLELFSKHSLMDLRLRGSGDVDVDTHHLVEDIAICLGSALDQALIDKAKIARYGQCCLPMDEALVLCSVDLSGRAYLQMDLQCEPGKVGDFDVELAQDFFYALASNANINLHLRQLSGKNRHHILEAAFKSFARALRQAATVDPLQTGVPSTKGVL
ncbi:MAG: imidazoleglycerol-phosphate dehydratase [Armatimonadetes bacterium CG2_30_59_28]|nr:imidazoleglycerol-phosphate dehydratase HisB [Armatimonadota bacterium]OIO96525.1 MAG: imidazoleglycerol-phosphate dehydratase [Armatimonadetes bacterium CG2_30_59_28]PIU64310.1 MAG: imidazoleglycerol-phosphate dehydratase HisB [Armatimonadetes bacterium CG07_land_8_20_14_0_80_59_28]PIX40803.1 MAG: imidazoleglycerol-phosphate dehydratase HisB [Armatimonadetes bacterium CG_4_8_14_3_um_filter_58_9]PIY44782.1 MAG: imidazoleglycerol-phosphate dehydratase HisB [Armatimonadetes bacterium CG_4_10_1